jgi:hypothetical protein
MVESSVRFFCIVAMLMMLPLIFLIQETRTVKIAVAFLSAALLAVGLFSDSFSSLLSVYIIGVILHIGSVVSAAFVVRGVWKARKARPDAPASQVSERHYGGFLIQSLLLVILLVGSFIACFLIGFAHSIRLFVSGSTAGLVLAVIGTLCVLVANVITAFAVCAASYSVLHGYGSRIEVLQPALVSPAQNSVAAWRKPLAVLPQGALSLRRSLRSLLAISTLLWVWALWLSIADKSDQSLNPWPVRTQSCGFCVLPDASVLEGGSERSAFLRSDCARVPISCYRVALSCLWRVPYATNRILTFFMLSLTVVRSCRQECTSTVSRCDRIICFDRRDSLPNDCVWCCISSAAGAIVASHRHSGCV